MIRSKYISAVNSDTLPDANSMKKKSELTKSPNMKNANEKTPMKKLKGTK